MLEVLRLIPALQVIFRYQIEFKADSFEPLNEAQKESWKRRVGGSGEGIYRIVNIEPCIERKGEELILVELPVVTDEQRKQILAAVKFIHLSTPSMPKESTEFWQRLEYLKKIWPEEITSGVDQSVNYP